MLAYPLGLAAVACLALCCYLMGPSVPAESQTIKAAARSRTAAMARVPSEQNGFTVIAYVLRPGNPPERTAIYNLAQENFQAIRAFRGFRPVFDHALERPHFLYPPRQGDAVEGLRLTSWLARAYLVEAEREQDPGARMRAGLKAWRLGFLTVQNDSLPTLKIGLEMVSRAAASLRPLVANGKLSRAELLELHAGLEANRLDPGSLVRAADAEAAHFEDTTNERPLAGAGAALPGFLADAYRHRQVQVYDVCYMRVRPNLQRLEDHPDVSRSLLINNGDRMVARAFPELTRFVRSYRQALDSQDQLQAAIALQLAWNPLGGYPPLATKNKRLRFHKDRLTIDGVEMRLKPARATPTPATAPAETASPES